MNFETRIKGIQDWIKRKDYLEDSLFDKKKLVKQKYLNFQIDDCYHFTNEVEGTIRNSILKVLYTTFSNWKTELNNLNIPFYLGVWVYNPRLPKSEVVCAIGSEEIEYYQKCFDISNEPKSIIELKDFKKERLIWTQKIDSDILEEWEINFPKENYESEKRWLEDQEYYRNFIESSYKVIKNKNRKSYFKNVGEIWTGELIKK